MKNTFFILLILLNTRGYGQTGNAFAKGADVGWLSQMENSGRHFYDTSGLQRDCLDILQHYGVNSIRLRVWVHPSGNWCGTADVVKQAMRAKSKGFRIMIDFHYSDSWADWAHQPKPAAWANDSFIQLLTDVYSYTYHVMDTLKQNGVVPEWVEVGNEITNGMLFPDGSTQHFARLAQLINKGYDAVKAADKEIKVIIHLHDGANNKTYRWFFDSLKTNGGKFDIIGMSYYPAVKSWPATNYDLMANVNDMIARYDKPVMICETGMDYTAPQAAKDMLTNLISKLRAVPGNKVPGIFYWEPESYNWGYNLSAWANDGKPTVAMEAFLH
jgi:arabinogalactan endo-1,4-beta-galactosidase